MFLLLGLSKDTGIEARGGILLLSYNLSIVLSLLALTLVSCWDRWLLITLIDTCTHRILDVVWLFLASDIDQGVIHRSILV